MEFDLEDSKQKNEKRDLQLCQLECENRVFKKMMRKYDDLVDGLRQTVKKYFKVSNSIFWIFDSKKS